MFGRDILTWSGGLSFKVQYTEECGSPPPTTTTTAVHCGVHREFCISVLRNTVT